MSNTMSTISWQFLLDNLEDRQCILCVGPDIYAQSGMPRFEHQLADFLRQHEKDLHIRVYDNGWFHYLPGHNKSSVWKKLEEFYRQPNPKADALMEKLACLPFESIISFLPDYRVKEVFETKRLDTQFKSFQKNLPCVAETPTTDKPLVFNLLGELKKGNSLVLTYNDFYAYLKSVFEEKSIPEKLAEKISDAQHFIFLGLSFDKWYTHMFMNIINSYVDIRKEKDQTIHRIAANTFLQPSDMERASEQHALTFVNDDIVDFVDELHRRCAEKNLLVSETIRVSRQPVSVFDAWRRAIKTGDNDKILDVLEKMADYTVGSDNDLDSVLILTGQYNRFLSDKKRGKFETQRAESAAETAIVDGILGTISIFERHTSVV
jgi:hypothetical protein